MATHDYVIANGTGAAVRSDLNGALAAIVSQNSSATEPATMYAYQWWADTTTGLLKIRNSSNSAWITIGTLASANLGLLPLAGGTMTGVLAVTAGTAALPGIAVSGDTNTGIYSPGADQLAISTGGTPRITVDASGNLGLGVTPSTWSGLTSLSIGSTGSSISSAANDNLYLTSGAYFNGTNWIYKTTSQLVSSYQQLSGIHRWNIAAGGTAGNAITFTQAMTLDASGRLGIGTNGPSYRLDVQENTANTITRLLNTATTTNSLATQIIAGNNGSTSFQIDVDGLGSVFGTGARLGTTTNHFLSFMTNSTEKARIDTSGRLLVGIIASPAYQLQVSTDSAGKPSSSLWTIVSDERIKEDIELADLDLCYEAIKAIPLKRYKWRDDIYTAEQVTDRRKLGWIAQDVEAIFPKAVGTHEFKYNQVFEETIIPAVEEELDDEGNVTTPAQPERIEKGKLISEDAIEDCRDLNSDQLYAAMYGAVQKLMVKVETLEASNTELLARLFALEGPTG